MPALELGLEQHLVRPGGAVTVRLDAGDVLTVVDVDGRQPAGVGFSVPAAVVGGGGWCALFGETSPPGASETFQVEQATAASIAVIGGPMDVEGQNPPSPVRVLIRRAVPRAQNEPMLPEPLADPVVDLRVSRATAEAYEVAAGQWIQVIDVEGQQCSDLLAFDARRLQDGVERGLDPTATRTFMGALYPGPGLSSKYVDTDFQPLLEVVRDTVGRHDTFGLACTAKYYEDLGYPGHVNCSDNFNGALERYGVAPRRGWPAVNLWYNTQVSAANEITLDEPWSRPGDYMLLRATKDLVVASSACPDDVNATNGWNPTDVHVRVYPAERTFSKAIARRVTPDAEPALTKETGFMPRWNALTRRVTEYRGYWLPTSFSGNGMLEEYWACRERAAVMDLSPLRKYEITGPDAEVLVQATVTRDIRKLAVGQVVYTAMCNHHGGVMDDVTIFRLGDDLFRLVGGEPHDGVWLREQATRMGLRVWVKESTDQLHNLAVQGPASRELLRGLIWTPPTQPSFDELRWFRFAVGRWGGADGRPLVVSRTGYTGELGYELWCHPSDAGALWDAVFEAGQPHGLLPLGLDALNVLRIEAGLVFAGAEFDDTIDPFEAGIGFTVALSAEEDFIGRAALERRKAHPQRVLVGLELAGNETAGQGDCVHLGRPQVGTVTSGCRSPVLRTNIALARVDVHYAALGTELEVGKLDGHQKRIPATVVRFPFYDPDKTKPRS
ncbi:MAG: DUF1989 domain-containing protein [Ilumatobacteraceae bacterium]